MSQTSHDIARAFFAALSKGALPDDLLTEDMTAWTTTSGGGAPRAKYQGGVRLLGSLFPAGLHYSIDSLTAEADRVAAEVHAEGVLEDSETFTNSYVFILRIRDGRIASVAEHFNPEPVQRQLKPLFAAAMARMAN